MNTHIVRVNEKIESIVSLYNLTEDEVMKINQHIKDWEHLIPGTKLRLPRIPEIVQTELDNTEPFIEEYYPKITEEDLNKIIEKPTPPPSNSNQVNIKPKKNNSYISYQSYYPMNGYYNSKYYNEYIRRKDKK